MLNYRVNNEDMLMTQKLQTLDPQARHLVSEDFLAGTATPDWANHLKPFGRDVDLEPFLRILDKAMERFGTSPASSDSWLAPRVHATLRLTRREAADPRVWDYLAVIAVPKYVRWRWTGEKGQAARFVGPEYKHALARLWWGAEMTRNGTDYSWTAVLFANQDFQNSWARLDLFHHRPASIAAAKLLSTFNKGQMATSDQIRQLVIGFNMVLTTTILDAVAENPAPDAEAVQEWTSELPDETRMFEDNPVGPADAPIPEVSIDAVVKLLEHTASVTSFFKRARTKKADLAPA